MKLLLAALAVLLACAAVEASSDYVADPQGDVKMQSRGNATVGHAPEIDILNVTAQRTDNNLVLTMDLAGEPIGHLDGQGNVSQVAYMFFLESLDEGQEPSSRTGTVGTWADVVRCSAQRQTDFTCAAAKATLDIRSVRLEKQAVTLEAGIHNETLFQNIGVGGFTILFRGSDNALFFMDLTRNADAANSEPSRQQATNNTAPQAGFSVQPAAGNASSQSQQSAPGQPIHQNDQNNHADATGNHSAPIAPTPGFGLAATVATLAIASRRRR